MAKHVIEEEFLKGSGFNLVTNGEVNIAADTADRVLSLKTDGTLDVDIVDNALTFKVRTPVFKTKAW